MVVFLFALASATFAQEATPPPPEAETQVAQTLEELRKGELLLDASHLEPLLAYSFTLVEGCAPFSGRFAYLELLRSLRAAGAQVTRLRFYDTTIKVYGGSAVVTYRFQRHVKGGPQPGKTMGFSTDVLEKREDGLWVLVHRHRVGACSPTGGNAP
jgi:ketosteroid isomerase-like protein